MKPIDLELIYPDLEDLEKWGPNKFQPMLESFGYEIKVRTDDSHDAYQGDTRVLFHNNNQWGILLFGWGTCPGCDFLKGVTSYINPYEELNHRRNYLHSQIRWRAATETLEWLRAKDWSAEIVYHSCEEATEQFTADAISCLEQALKDDAK